jgi:phage baseplate assembly protein W
MFYHGLSSKNWMKTKNLGISDIEVVKQDLMNHIYTPIGSRVMMPTFGTRIPLMTFEPNDEITRQIIEDDLRAVFEYDPRVQLVTLQVLSVPDHNTISAFADLLFIEFKVTHTIHIEVKTGG